MKPFVGKWIYLIASFVTLTGENERDTLQKVTRRLRRVSRFLRGMRLWETT